MGKKNTERENDLARRELTVWHRKTRMKKRGGGRKRADWVSGAEGRGVTDLCRQRGGIKEERAAHRSC